MTDPETTDEPETPKDSGKGGTWVIVLAILGSLLAASSGYFASQNPKSKPPETTVESDAR